MTFFYNSSTGGFANESPPALQYFAYETQLRLGQGWHAYGTIAAMQAAIKANGWPPPDASKGLLSGTSTVPTAPARAANAASNALLGNLSYKLQAGGIAGWFFRGLKIFFGGILMIIGISKMTTMDNKAMQLVSRLPIPIPV